MGWKLICPQVNSSLSSSGSAASSAAESSALASGSPVSASGASEKMDYPVSLGYLSDPSYIASSSFDRYTARANVNANITDWLKSGAKFSYTHRKTNS